MSDYSWIGPVAQAATAMFGEQKASEMTKEQLELLRQQLADVRGVPLPYLANIRAEELGPSAVGGMESDAALRGKQLQAIATLQNLIDKGGLDLTDQAALEDALGQVSAQQRRARAGVASDMAQRGQLDGGARIVMDLNAAQRGANDARKTGMETAAMAQRRRLQAIRDAAGMAGGLREQDWREKETVNRARDLREERNSAARERATMYNAGLPQQNFTNALAKATGQLPSTSAVGNVLASNAADVRNSAAGMVQAIGAYNNVNRNGGTNTGGGGGGYSYTSDPDNLTTLSNNPYPGMTEDELNQW